MPYPGQVAGKTGHADIVRNPDVQSFLQRCCDVPRPTPDDIKKLLSEASDAVCFGEQQLPGIVLALDGSSYEASPDGGFPSRRIGYVKISSVALDMERYKGLRVPGARTVDPLVVNALLKDTEAFSMALPGAYVIPAGRQSSKEGFRYELQNYLMSDRTRLAKHTLYDTLQTVWHAMDRIEPDGKGGHFLKVGCTEDLCDGKAAVDVKTNTGKCNSCGADILFVDSLRLHEPFMETGDNQAVLNRLMNGIEHLLMLHYVLYLREVNPKLLSRLCIISDGPLALFGEMAPLHRGIMKILGVIREQQHAAGLDEPLIIGFSKTGRIVEHFASIDNLIAEAQAPHSFVFPVSDEYRYTYLEPAKDKTVNHGKETYYGQDFYIRMPSGRGFVMGLPYPFSDRSRSDFQTAKTDLSNYKATIGRALRVIKEFESDLYGSSLVPITLAHQHASISLKPGGRVLDILSRQSLKND